MKLRHTGIIFFLITFSPLSLSSPVLAHFPWINASDYTPQTGSALDLTVGWGHAYPFSPLLPKGSVETMTLTGPGKALPKLAFTSELEISTDSSITTPGAYIVAITRKPGYHTKTATGYHASSKKGLDHVISCSYSHMSAKALINVGDGKGKVDTPVGHPLEIIPMTNPADLREGERMTVKIIYKNQPWSGMVFATYAGFSMEKETFGYATKTDKDGMAAIRILNHGVWLLKVSQEEPFPDTSECDTETYVASLTFEVR